MSIVEMLGFDEAFKENYLVEDGFGSEAVRVLFILDSPHTDEVRNKYPAAGKTGDVVAQVLLDNYRCSLGELIHRKDPSTKVFGVMNVCQIPMQLSAYPQKKEKSEAALITLDRLKNYNRRPYSVDQHKTEIQRAIATRPVFKQILREFSVRYKNALIAQKPKLVVPCGVLAQGFFEAVQKNPPVLGNAFPCTLEGHTYKAFYMYHPSPKSGETHSSWATKKTVMDNLKREIEAALR